MGFQNAYDDGMVIIRFPDKASDHQALGYLAGRFSFTAWSNGETMVPPAALMYLAMECIRFSVEGLATDRHYPPKLRNPSGPVVIEVL